MRQAIHHHYDQLTDNERRFVDKIFHHKEIYEWANHFDVPLAGDDRVERAVDALARAVIESRPKQVEVPLAPKLDEPEEKFDSVMELHSLLKGVGLL